MKVSDRNEVVVEGFVRRNRSLSGDAAAELDIQVQSRRREARRGKTIWRHDRFDIEMSGARAKFMRSRIRRGCIVRVFGHLRSKDVPDSKLYIEAKDIEVLRQPASKRPGGRKKGKAKGGDATQVTVTTTAIQPGSGVEQPEAESTEQPAAESSERAAAQTAVEGDAAVPGTDVVLRADP